MARIGKAEYPKILQAVDGEGRRVVEVAAEYGCTPANIYALLSKLRRIGKDAPPPAKATVSVPVEQPKPATIVDTPTLVGDAGNDLFANPVHWPVRVSVATSGSDQVIRAVVEPTPTTELASPDGTTSRADQAPRPGHASVTVAANITSLPRRTLPAESDRRGAALAKPGFGLLMRNTDGEESLTPFRSLEELLSAIKPALRAAARCPDQL